MSDEDWFEQNRQSFSSDYSKEIVINVLEKVVLKLGWTTSFEFDVLNDDDAIVTFHNYYKNKTLMTEFPLDQIFD